MYFNVQKKDDTTHVVSGKEVTKETYLKLSKDASEYNHDKFFESLKNDFDFDYQKLKDFIDKLALSTQIVIKESKMLYLHGYLLYVALDEYLKKNPAIDFVNIIETGTARGFSANKKSVSFATTGRTAKAAWSV